MSGVLYKDDETATRADPGRRPIAANGPAVAAGIAVAVGVAYFLAARLSLALLNETDGVALFWPAAGLSLGALIALGRAARWPVVAGVVAATVIAELTSGVNIWHASSSALWNAGEALLAAWLIERCFGPGFNLDRLRNVLGLLAVAVAAAAASGLGGMMSLKLFGHPAAPMESSWQYWLMSDAVGMIVVAPLVIGVAATLRAPPPRMVIFQGLAALTALAAVMAIIVLLSPVPWRTVGPAALVLTVLVMMTACCPPLFAAAAAFVVSLTIVSTMIFGVGHFGDPGVPVNERVLDGQTTVVAFALYAYVLAAVFAERRRHAAALEAGRRGLQEALTIGAIVAFESNATGNTVRLSDNATEILGLGPRDAVTVDGFLAHVHPDDLPQFKAHYRRPDPGSPATHAFRFIRPDGAQQWLEETSRAEFDGAGRLVSFKGLTRDITKRKQDEQRQDLLTDELDHRVKNVLARVAAIVTQMGHGGPGDEFVRDLHGRIQSMAAAHALLSQSRWSDVGLTDVVRHQLAPYTTDANTTISGPAIMLTSAQTQAVAMVIHELVTNAAKHGALSRSGGRVSVSWDITAVGAAAGLTMLWTEHDGPPITAPADAGYGLRLIRNLIPHELGGDVKLEFRPQGACCRIEIGLESKQQPGRG